MIAAPVPADEAPRLLDLALYGVLGPERDLVLSRICRVAARLLRVPVALVNFIGADCSVTMGSFGTETGSEVQAEPRGMNFCAWAILQSGPVLVPDLAADPRFAGHPLVARQAGYRTYAAAPLVTPGGQRIGALCVLDTEVRALDLLDLEVLSDLASMVMSELHLRAELSRVQREVEVRAAREVVLQRGLMNARTLEGVAALMDLPLGPREVAVNAAELIGRAISADWAGLVTFKGEEVSAVRVHAVSGLHPVLFDMAEHLNVRARGRGVTHSMETLEEALYIDCYAALPGALPEAVLAGLRSVAYVPLGRWEGTTFLLLVFRAGDLRSQPWRQSDRHLLEAAARSVQAALVRRGAAAAAASLARTDALSSALNRAAFDHDLSLWQAGGQTFTLAVIDLDGFKAINDARGHQAGDQVLQVFTDALINGVDGGVTYRIGGDEFALLFPGEASEALVVRQVELAVLVVRQKLQLVFGASVGLAVSTEPGEVTVQADLRMYGAKRRRQLSQAGV